VRQLEIKVLNIIDARCNHEFCYRSVKQSTHFIAKNIFHILCIFFWVFPPRQIVVGRRFGTLYQFHLQRLGVQCQPLKTELIQGSETSVNYNLTPGKYPQENIQGGSNMTGTDLYVNKPHCAAAVRP